jgi:hypothetical protein
MFRWPRYGVQQCGIAEEDLSIVSVASESKVRGRSAVARSKGSRTGWQSVSGWWRCIGGRLLRFDDRDGTKRDKAKPR